MGVFMQKVLSAISFIPASDRDVWIKVGMAIKAEYGDLGFDIWNEWSQSAESYSKTAAEAAWRSFRSRKVSIGTLFFLATQNGWEDDGSFKPISAEELRLRKEKEEKRRKAEEARILRDNKRAASKALLLWRAATPLQPDHPYIVRKQVIPVETLREIGIEQAVKILGYRPRSEETHLTGRLIVVPIKINGTLASCEMIDESGVKTAIYGSARLAGYWAAQPLPEDSADVVIAVGEGVATMLSAKLATGYYAIGALTHHNIAAVVDFFKTRYSKAHLLILGDLCKKTGGPDKCAIDASKATNVTAVFPQFDKTQAGKTDFNDMHVAYGLQSINRVIGKCAL